MGAGAEQQEGCGAVAQRRRRQRHPRRNVAELQKAGYTLIDGGAYETGTTSFSAQIAKFKAAQCEILTTFPIPPDYATFWRQAAQQGLHRSMKVVQVAKTGLFASDIEVLGPLGYGTSVSAYWHKDFPYKSTLTGMSGSGAGRQLREGIQPPMAAAAGCQHVVARCRC